LLVFFFLLCLIIYVNKVLKKTGERAMVQYILNYSRKQKRLENNKHIHSIHHGCVFGGKV
jgi:hypothetical protein